jgi:hypothetical protein
MERIPAAVHRMAALPRKTCLAACVVAAAAAAAAAAVVAVPPSQD